MKLPAICTLALLAAASASQAGSFGGPPPFTDLSPLQSGIDGSYQATARGTNLTGIIRFAYQNGVQSPVSSGNQYAFFVAGNVVTGGVAASITGKKLAGVLGGQDFSVPTNNGGNAQLPLVFIVQGNRANGQFTGNMDLEDKLSAFNGKGNISPAPAETNTVVLVNTNSGSVFVDSGGGGTVIIDPFIIPGSSIVPTDFTFEGVRTSVFAQGTGTGAATTN
ncbi:MAG: hypothetical protein PHC88_02695 [Terrimicrobiaceae bacterium]|nr:hypothetical protein [Terrimicrobiaceae bacterium]